MDWINESGSESDAPDGDPVSESAAAGDSLTGARVSPPEAQPEAPVDPAASPAHMGLLALRAPQPAPAPYPAQPAPAPYPAQPAPAAALDGPSADEAIAADVRKKIKQVRRQAILEALMHYPPQQRAYMALPAWLNEFPDLLTVGPPEPQDTSWSCVQCTFSHVGAQASYLACEMCGAQRPTGG